MSNEIATYSMILSKLSLGQSGTECPTKTQILAINSLIVIDNASTYGANECVKIDDIRKKVETWNYYLTVSPTSMSFGAGGGSKTFTVSSYKRKVLDGVEQSGDTSVSLKSTTISGTGFSLSGTTVSASANEGTSNRTGTVTITQNESNKTATISLSQSGYTPTYTFNVTPTNLSVDAISNTYSFTVNSSKTILNDDGSVSSERIRWTGTDDADWIYLINASNRPNQIGTVTNETTLQRTAKITLTQDGTGIQAFVNVIQEAGVESKNELYINSIHYDSVHLFGNGEVPHPGNQNYFLVQTGIPLVWKTSIGLVVNGGTVYAGDTISVYVSSNNSYTLLRTFALETGVQRVIV